MTELLLDYSRYFGFRCKPFEAQDPNGYFTGAGYRDAYRGLCSNLPENRSIHVLTGTTGSGKSLLLNTLIREQRGPFQFVIVNAARLNLTDLVNVCCEQLSLSGNDTLRSGDQWQLLCRYLDRLDDHGANLVLVVDDADRLHSHELTSLLQSTGILGRRHDRIRLLLAGTFHIEEMLSRQAAQMAAAAPGGVFRQTLLPLTPAQAGEFIGQQMTQVAGYYPFSLFSKPVIRRLHRHSRGVLGHLSLLCDHTLLTVQLTGMREVSLDVVDQTAAACGIFDRSLISRPDKTLRIPILRKLQEINRPLRHMIPLLTRFTPESSAIS